MMDPEKREAINYRFSGYQLPKIQLDSTGATYYVVRPHPYFYNQPLYWQKPCYSGEYARTGPLPDNPVEPSSSVTGPPADEPRWSMLPLLSNLDKR